MYPTFCFSSLDSFDKSVSFQESIFLEGRIYLRRKTRTDSCVTNGIRTRDDFSGTKGFDRSRHRLHGRCHWKALVYETAIIQNASLAASAVICSGFKAGVDSPSGLQVGLGELRESKDFQTRCLSLNGLNSARTVKWGSLLCITGL